MSTFTTMPKNPMSKDKPRTFTEQQVLSNSDIAFLHGCRVDKASAVKRRVLEKFGKVSPEKAKRGRPKAGVEQKIAYWQYKETFGV